ncbi:MAG: AraC family transcriptional regulator [Oscillospiraceae bacterium]
MAKESYAKAITIYYCGSEECQNGHFFGPAVRTQYLLHYVVYGKGVYQVCGHSYGVKAGEGFLIKPGESTYYRADDEDPWGYMWVAFDGFEAGEMLDACGLGYLMCAKNPVEFQEKMSTLIRIFGSPEHNDYEYLSLFYGMMSQLVIPRPQAVGSFRKEYFDKAAAYIHNNYSYPITIADIAKYVGIDRTYLYKIFVEQKNLSPKQFLLQTRINAAKNMMSDHSYSLSEVSLSCGFKDSPSFCGHFKRLTGKTPKQFKSEISRNQAFNAAIKSLV